MEGSTSPVFPPDFEYLPNKIKDNHSILSASLLQNLNLPKYSLEDPKKIISNLHNCIINNKSTLNHVAFTDHTSNFRIQSISEFFGKVDITGLPSKLKNNKAFKEFILNIFGQNFDLSRAKDEIVFSTLNNLAQRRNDISHGSSDDDILGNDILIEYIEFIRQFSKGINEILYKKVLPYECSAEFKVVKAIAIHNKNILCINAENVEIKIGDRVIFKPKKESELYDEGVIKNIQIKNVNYDQVTITNEEDLGLELDKNVKMNQEFYIRK